MGKHGRRSIGFYVSRREMTVLDPLSGRLFREPVGAEHDLSEFRAALERLYESMGKPANHMQLAFSDDLLLFASWPMETAPRRQAELSRLAKWRLTRITSHVESYELGYQLVGAATGFVLLVSAVPLRLMNQIRDFVRDKRLRWTVADSSASFVFNHLKPEIKEKHGSLLVYSENQWTLLTWDQAGAVDLVKPGTFSSAEANRMQEAISEASRLIHAKGTGGEKGRGDRVMVWGDGSYAEDIQSNDDLYFEVAEYVLRPEIQSSNRDFGRLLAELASYTR